jgi:propionate catabolism operon transcriptional regulator
LEDIPLLLDKLLHQYRKPARVISPAMLEGMRRHSWPGNIRELLAVIESYLILLGGTDADEPLFAELFRENTAGARRRPREQARFDPGSSLRDNLERAKASIVRQTVAFHGGDKKSAARHLGISYTTLWRALHDHDGEAFPAGLVPDDESVLGM